MIKKHISIRLEARTIDFLDNVAETNGLSRSNALALVVNITRDYFSMDQIAAECKVRGIADGRCTKQPSTL